MLCGGDRIDSMGWCIHTFMWARMPEIGRIISEETLPDRLEWPGLIKEMQSKFGDHCAPECVAYSPKAAKSAAPWWPWQKDYRNLKVVQEFHAGTNTGQSIPYYTFPDSRVLVTTFLCSREMAEKIAAHYGGRIPIPMHQAKIDQIAQLIPDGLMAHSAPMETVDLKVTKFWNGNRVEGSPAESNEAVEIPEGSVMTILNRKNTGYLMAVPSRALLVIEWPILSES